MISSSGEQQLDHVRSRHSVKFYGADKSALVRHVTSYVEEALNAGETAILIATATHREAFYREMPDKGIDLQHALRNGQLLFLDAHETLARISSSGRVDKAKVWSIIRGLLDEASAEARGLSIYGEMVGLLWQDGNHDVAIELERMWNELQHWKVFTLLCSYPIDVFEREFNVKAVDDVLCSHHHLLSSRDDANVLEALESAMDEILDGRADDLRPLIKANHRPAWGTVPAAESLILWLRNNLPGHAESIIGHAKSRLHVRQNVI